MIIILEGPDGSGKTTLGHTLSKELGIYYDGSKILQTNQQYINHVDHQEDLANSNKVTLVDRCPWISELVYSPIRRHAIRINLAKIQYYWSLPQIVIYCSPTGITKLDVSREYKEHKNQDLMASVLKNHEKIINQYEKLFDTNKSTFSGFYQYNWKIPGEYDKLVKYLKDRI